MSATRLADILQYARQQGLLPEESEAAIASDASRPWPVVVLTGLGAWLAAIPLLLFVVFFSGFVTGFGGALLTGCVIVAVTARGLWAGTESLFIEQLAIAGLIVGLGLCGAGLAGALGESVAAALLGVLVLGMAVVVPQAWLRALLGAAALAMLLGAVYGIGLFDHGGLLFMLPQWVVLNLLLAVWVVALAAQHRLAGGVRGAAVIEAAGAGWLAMLLLVCAQMAGSGFLVGANPGMVAAQALEELAGPRPVGALWPGLVLSSLLTLAAAGWLARAWVVLRRPWCAGTALVLAALAAFMPTLGAVLLAGAICVTSGRQVLACGAAVAATWILGAFYYQLAWPLVTKAGVLVAAGAVLGALAVWGMAAVRVKPAAASAATRSAGGGTGGRVSWAIALGTAAVLLVAGVGVWQKELLIAHGRQVFVPLAPVDPRSLMQGDYMALNFVFGNELPQNGPMKRGFEAPRLILQLDGDGVAVARRRDDGSSLRTGEIAIRLVPRYDRWMLVTDAFYFPEGEAERWAGARFGEFRVDQDGSALLVGLRGEGLAPL